MVFEKFLKNLSFFAVFQRKSGKIGGAGGDNAEGRKGGRRDGQNSVVWFAESLEYVLSGQMTRSGEN